MPTNIFKNLPPKYSEMSIISKPRKFLNSLVISSQKINTRAKI